MQRTDCYQTLQGSAKKLVSVTGLIPLLWGMYYSGESVYGKSQYVIIAEISVGVYTV